MKSDFSSNYYFLPKNKVDFSKESSSKQCIYFDEKLKHLTSSPQTGGYAVEVIVVRPSYNMGSLVPFKFKDGTGFLAKEKVLGSVIQLSGKICTTARSPSTLFSVMPWRGKMTALADSETTDLTRRVAEQFARLSPASTKDSIWNVIEPRKTTVQFAAETPQEREDKLTANLYKKQIEEGTRQPLLRGIDLLCKQLRKVMTDSPLWKGGASLCPRPLYFVEAVLTHTLNFVAKELEKGKVSQEEAFKLVATSMNKHIQDWNVQKESILYEDFEAMKSSFELHNSNLVALVKEFNSGAWKKGERRQVKHRSLDGQELAHVLRFLPTFFKAPSIQEEIEYYLIQNSSL